MRQRFHKIPLNFELGLRLMVSCFHIQACVCIKLASFHFQSQVNFLRYQSFQSWPLVSDSRFTTADSWSALMLARLLVLASDAAIATKDDSSSCSTLMKICQTLASFVNSINTHAYMSVHKADKAAVLFNLLLQELGTKGEH